MAISIKSIPTLKNCEAAQFQKNIQRNNERKRSVSFQKQVKSANKILAKSNMI